ncbi:hypothetical protein EYC84_005411 [Monilinia fructicola]|uniref:Uncharacterized protein n=1 Tax=Monilinia fructicola TaxID=38448 RepID=A0A5M9JWF0_MONFR|nr:hypothetical protein EYC84_005411 [Monilinia fructicola]
MTASGFTVNFCGFPKQGASVFLVCKSCRDMKDLRLYTSFCGWRLRWFVNPVHMLVTSQLLELPYIVTYGYGFSFQVFNRLLEYSWTSGDVQGLIVLRCRLSSSENLYLSLDLASTSTCGLIFDPGQSYDSSTRDNRDYKYHKSSLLEN